MWHGVRSFGRFTAVRPPRWQLALVVAAVLSIGIALAIVATGVFLIALPVVLAAALARKLFGSRRGPRRDAPSRPSGPVIDAEYEVVPARHARPDRSPWSR